MDLKCILICLCCCFITQSNVNAVSFIKPCKADDSKCILASGREALPYIAAGIPEYGMPPIDPIFVDSVRADGVNLKFGLRNIQFSGVSKCNIVELYRNTANSTIKLAAECPITGKGQYDLNGKLFIIEVVGDGDFEVKTNKLRLTIEAKIKDIQKDGKRHWKVTGFDYTYDFLEKAYFKFDNLFGGDKVRAKPFEDVIDHSWKEFVEEVAGPIFKQVLTPYMDHVKKLFLSVPADELEIV